MKVTPSRMQFRKKLVEPSHGFFVLSLIALSTTFQVSQVGLKHEEAETVTVKPPICWNYLSDSCWGPFGEERVRNHTFHSRFKEFRHWSQMDLISNPDSATF